mgnify:CR=1 FL=1
MFRDENGYDLPSILGAVMVIVGAFCCVDTLCIWLPGLSVLDVLIYSEIIPDMFILAGGIAALATRSESYCTRIALAGMCIGASFLILNIFFTDFYEYLSFIVGIIAFIVGVMILISSASLLCGYTHYATRLLQCTAIMTVIELFPIWASYNMLMPWSDIFSMYYCIPLMIAVYIVMLACLMHESVRIPSATQKADRNLGMIKDVIYSDPETYITPEDAESLKGFVEKHASEELDIPLRCGKEERILRIGRTDGGVPKATVVPGTGENLMSGFRFDVCTLVYDGGDMLRIYGREGVFVQISVRPAPKKRAIKGSVRLMSKIVPEDDS